MFLGFKIWNGKPPITQWYSFTFKKKKIASKSGAKCFVNLHLVLTCMKLLLYLLIKNIVQIGIIVFKASQHIYFLCSAGKENDCLQQAVLWLFATGSIMIVCNRQYFSVVFTIRVLYNRSVWTPYKQHGTLSASCVHIASSPLVETSSTLRKENRTVRKVGIFLSLFIIFFADSLGLKCFCVAF